MFFWSRGDEFDDVQNLLRGNTIFADNMFLNITPNGVSFHDISHYSDYLHAFIFHTYNYIYSHFIPSVFSIFSILIMFLIAKLLTGKIIGMGDVKLYMVLALNAEYRIILCNYYFNVYVADVLYNKKSYNENLLSQKF